MFANREAVSTFELCSSYADLHDVRLYLHSLVKHWSVPFSNPDASGAKRGHSVTGIIFNVHRAGPIVAANIF